MNLEAQKSISATIQQLIREKNVGIVAMEGAFGPIDYDVFKKELSSDVLKNAADAMLGDKKMSGALHGALLSSIAVPIVGIDDREHYDANVAAYRRASRLSMRARQEIYQQQMDLQKQTESQWSPDLKKFHTAVEGFRNGRLTVTEYLPVLIKTAGGTVPKSIVQFVEASDLEAAIDFRRAEVERQHFAEELSRNPGQSIPALMKHFPLLADYLHYRDVSQQIDVPKLFSDIRQLEIRILKNLCRSDEDWKLVQESRELYLKGRLIEFGMTRDEWKELKKVSLLPRQGEGQGWGPFLQFYEQAEIRDEKMALNLLKVMKNPTPNPSPSGRVTSVVLVTGGFHSEGLNQRLKAAGYNVVEITPTITKLDPQNASSYLSVFNQQKSPLDRLFEGQKLFLAPEEGTPQRRLTLATRSTILAGNNPISNKTTLFRRLTAGTKITVWMAINVGSLLFTIVRSSEKFLFVATSFHGQFKEGYALLALGIIPLLALTQNSPALVIILVAMAVPEPIKENSFSASDSSALKFFQTNTLLQDYIPRYLDETIKWLADHRAELGGKSLGYLVQALIVAGRLPAGANGPSWKIAATAYDFYLRSPLLQSHQAEDIPTTLKWLSDHREELGGKSLNYFVLALIAAGRLPAGTSEQSWKIATAAYDFYRGSSLLQSHQAEDIPTTLKWLSDHRSELGGNSLVYLVQALSVAGRLPNSASQESWMRSATAYDFYLGNSLLQSHQAEDIPTTLKWLSDHRAEFGANSLSYLVRALYVAGRLPVGASEQSWIMPAGAYDRAINDRDVIENEIRRIWMTAAGEGKYRTILARLKSEFEPLVLLNLNSGRPLSSSYRNQILTFAYHAYCNQLIQELQNHPKEIGGRFYGGSALLGLGFLTTHLSGTNPALSMVIALLVVLFFLWMTSPDGGLPRNRDANHHHDALDRGILQASTLARKFEYWPEAIEIAFERLLVPFTFFSKSPLQAQLVNQAQEMALQKLEEIFKDKQHPLIRELSYLGSYLVFLDKKVKEKYGFTLPVAHPDIAVVRPMSFGHAKLTFFDLKNKSKGHKTRQTDAYHRAKNGFSMAQVIEAVIRNNSLEVSPYVWAGFNFYVLRILQPLINRVNGLKLRNIRPHYGRGFFITGDRYKHALIEPGMKNVLTEMAKLFRTSDPHEMVQDWFRHSFEDLHMHVFRPAAAFAYAFRTQKNPPLSLRDVPHYLRRIPHIPELARPRADNRSLPSYEETARLLESLVRYSLGIPQIPLSENLRIPAKPEPLPSTFGQKRKTGGLINVDIPTGTNLLIPAGRSIDYFVTDETGEHMRRYVLDHDLMGKFVSARANRWFVLHIENQEEIPANTVIADALYLSLAQRPLVWSIDNNKSPLDPVTEFGNRAPVDVEIGFGFGEALDIESKEHDGTSDHPLRNYVGIEPHALPGQKKTSHLDGRRNVRVIDGRAQEVIPRFPKNSVDKFVLLFPYPIPVEEPEEPQVNVTELAPLFHDHEQDGFLEKLKPGGQVIVVSESAATVQWARSVLATHMYVSVSTIEEANIDYVLTASDMYKWIRKNSADKPIWVVVGTKTPEAVINLGVRDLRVRAEANRWEALAEHQAKPVDVKNSVFELFEIRSEQDLDRAEVAASHDVPLGLVLAGNMHISSVYPLGNKLGKGVRAGTIPVVDAKDFEVNGQNHLKLIDGVGAIAKISKEPAFSWLNQGASISVKAVTPLWTFDGYERLNLVSFMIDIMNSTAKFPWRKQLLITDFMDLMRKADEKSSQSA